MDDVIRGLNRVEGQVRGIKKMYEEQRDCEAIVQQVAAARSALKRVAEMILTEKAVLCSSDAKSREELKRIIENLVKVS